MQITDKMVQTILLAVKPFAAMRASEPRLPTEEELERLRAVYAALSAAQEQNMAATATAGGGGEGWHLRPSAEILPSGAGGYFRIPERAIAAPARPVDEVKATNEGTPIPNCRECQFYFRGECRRFPPPFRATNGWSACFTRVQDGYWCGEFRFLEPLPTAPTVAGNVEAPGHE